jgi:hypothetical protein
MLVGKELRNDVRTNGRCHLAGVITDTQQTAEVPTHIMRGHEYFGRSTISPRKKYLNFFTGSTVKRLGVNCDLLYLPRPDNSHFSGADESEAQVESRCDHADYGFAPSG